MTILAYGPTMIVCGHTGCVNRGSREHPLPKGLGQYAGKALEDVPTEALESYHSWLFWHDDGPDWFEMWSVEDELDKRREAAT